MKREILKEEFVKIYTKESDALFRFCVLRCPNRDTALDLTQETFMRLWDMLSRGEKIDNARALLFRIVRNLLIDWYRKKKALSLDAIEEEENEHISIVLRVDETIQIESEARYVLEKIQELDEIYREPVYLRFVEEMKPQEIAQALGQSPNTISVRINRGLAQLRKLLHHEQSI